MKKGRRSIDHSITLFIEKSPAPNRIWTHDLWIMMHLLCYCATNEAQLINQRCPWRVGVSLSLDRVSLSLDRVSLSLDRVSLFWFQTDSVHDYLTYYFSSSASSRGHRVIHTQVNLNLLYRQTLLNSTCPSWPPFDATFWWIISMKFASEVKKKIFCGDAWSNIIVLLNILSCGIEPQQFVLRFL